MLFFSKKQAIPEVIKRRKEFSDNHQDAIPAAQQFTVAFQFLLCYAGILLICFVGQSPIIPILLPKQIARQRIVADFPFNYESKIRTKEIIKQKTDTINPCYKIDLSDHKQFEQTALSLKKDLEQLALLNIKKTNHPKVFEITNKYQSPKFSISTSDVLHLISLKPAQISNAFSEALSILREIVQEGIGSGHDTSSFVRLSSDQQDQPLFMKSEKSAIHDFKTNLRSADIPQEAINAIIHIFKSGITPNFVYDKQKTTEKTKNITQSVHPQIVHIEEGSLIVDVGSIVSKEDYEKLSAYRQEFQRRQSLIWGFNLLFFQRAFSTSILLLCAFIGVYLTQSKIKSSPRLASLTFVVLMANLLAFRLLHQLTDTHLFSQNDTLLSILPYTLPIAMGSLIITIMVDTPTGFILSLLVAALNTLMQSATFEFFIILFLPIVSVVYFARRTKLRENIIKAGTLSGAILAVITLISTLINQNNLQLSTISEQMGTALFTGILTGVLTTGILPLLERLFRHTTDITLLELTDYNHPLLRKLQLIAPGTYHHSLMVASLAERAALEIKANPLFCRCCSLFHDIGKLVKPEYFIENQVDSMENPHTKQNPSMSALIIKSHVKEGVAIAKAARLPDPIIDVIEQHHGTSLIQYFYHKALKQHTDASHETIFRYDGPKPQTKESAIIMLADAIEAASRTLKKVSSQSIEELVHSITQEKMHDQQLSSCQISLKEIDIIQRSFCLTLLNTLHSRIHYPKMQELEQAALPTL